jgi:hypothetical protein
MIHFRRKVTINPALMEAVGPTEAVSLTKPPLTEAVSLTQLPLLNI